MHEDQGLAGVRAVVVVEVVVAFVGEEIVLGPAGPFLAPAELVVDVNEVRDDGGLEAVDRVAEGVVSPFPSTCSCLLAPDLGLLEVVAGEIHDRHADAGEDVGVGQFELVRRPLVVAVREHDTLGRIESGKSGERAEVPVVEGILHHPLLAREIEVAGLDAPSAVARIAPVIHLADAADEELGIHQSVIPPDVVRIHVGKIDVRHILPDRLTEAPLLEVPLDIVNERLVTRGQILVRQAEELLHHMLRGVEPHPIVVHGIAQPVDPADHEVARVLRR